MKVPNLRFKDKDGNHFADWEVKKLGKVCEINPKNSILPNSFIYIDLESVSGGVLLKENEILKDEAPSRAQRLLKKKDILFQMVRPYQMNNLYFEIEGDYVASTGYAQIRTMQNPQFIFQYLHYSKFIDEVIKNCTGTSYPAINSTDLSNIKVSVPSLTEQSKIANLLYLINERINTQNQIITELESLIKGIRQKIFSRQFRFKNDDGNEFPEWKIMKLGEIGEYKAGGDLNKLDFNKIKNENYIYPIYANGAGEGVYGYAKTFQYNSNCVTVSGRGNLGYANMRHQKFNAIVRLIVIKPKKYMNSKFLEEAINNINFVIESTGVPQLTVPQIRTYKILIPCIEEQVHIANFITSISKKIESEKKLLAEFENQKKYLLQNMFI